MRCAPFQVEWGIAHDVIEPNIGLIKANVFVLQICVGIEEVSNLVGLYIHLTAVEIRFDWHIVAKISNNRGEVSNSLIGFNLKCGHNELTYKGRGKELTIFNLFLGFRKLMIIIEVRIFQSM